MKETSKITRELASACYLARLIASFTHTFRYISNVSTGARYNFLADTPTQTFTQISLSYNKFVLMRHYYFQ